MAQRKTIDAWLRVNLPGYWPGDYERINRWWQKRQGHQVGIRRSWEQFKRFITVDWQGVEEVEVPKARATAAPAAKEEACSCGGRWVKRQNRQKLNYFYGCSNWPGCTNTKKIENE